jgi:hypothetical protein
LFGDLFASIPIFFFFFDFSVDPLTRNRRYGQCEGGANDCNKVFGSAPVGSEICQYSPGADGKTQMTCTLEADFPDELHPVDDSLADANRPGLRGVTDVQSQANLQLF